MAKNLWDRKKSTTYIKVGTFFLIAFLIFFMSLLSMREVNIFRGTYVLTVKFDFAEGLRPSSPIRFCGVDVGEVKSVEIKEEKGRPLVYVYAKVRKGINIPKNSYFFINSLSLFGEKYLEIDPPLIATSYLSGGDIIEGVSPIPLFNVFASSNKTMKEVSEFVREGKIKTSLENSLNNIEAITGDIKTMVQNMKDKKGTVGRLLYDDSLYKTTEEFIADIKAHPWKLLHKPKEPSKRKK